MSDGKKFKATFESDRYLLNYNMVYQSYDKNCGTKVIILEELKTKWLLIMR